MTWYKTDRIDKLGINIFILKCDKCERFLTHNSRDKPIDTTITAPRHNKTHLCNQCETYLKEKFEDYKHWVTCKEVLKSIFDYYKTLA